MTSWSLKRTKQCAKCPWRTDVNPYDIPNGYEVARHQALRNTIAQPDDWAWLTGSPLPVMACHETEDAHCVGWLAQQAGPGNNLGLRLLLLHCTNVHRLHLIGAQHATFADTLPPAQQGDHA